MPNNPLRPLLCLREDLHVLEAAPATVSVLNPKALYLRSSAVRIECSALVMERIPVRETICVKWSMLILLEKYRSACVDPSVQ